MKKLLALLVVLWSFVAIVFVAITTIGLVKGEKLGHPRPSPGQSYAVTVQGRRLFLSERDGRFIAFVDDAHHMGQERLWWCPVERVLPRPRMARCSMPMEAISPVPRQGTWTALL